MIRLDAANERAMRDHYLSARLTIATAVCGRTDVTKRFLETTILNCIEPPDLVIVSNGSTDDENAELVAMVRDTPMTAAHKTGLVVIRPDPMGSIAALNLAVSHAETDIIGLVHNDCFITEPGWDTKVIQFFASHPEAGLIGPAGAKRAGSDDIYKTPYRLEQLARGDVYTSLEEWQPHGALATEPIPVAVLDGMAMFCRRADFERWGGLDEGLGAHHLYDLDVCIRAHYDGRVNYVVPMQTVHASGQTANGSRYQAQFGSDAEVHRIAHERFYAKHRGRLPVVVP